MGMPTPATIAAAKAEKEAEKAAELKRSRKAKVALEVETKKTKYIVGVDKTEQSEQARVEMAKAGAMRKIGKEPPAQEISSGDDAPGAGRSIRPRKEPPVKKEQAKKEVPKKYRRHRTTAQGILGEFPAPRTYWDMMAAANTEADE
jgi:hypothetical protein